MRRLSCRGVCVLLAALVLSCDGREQDWSGEMTEHTVVRQELYVSFDAEAGIFPDTDSEARLREAGLIDITEVDPLVRVRLMYAEAGNFTGRVLYHGLRKAFMLPETARRLSEARKLLSAEKPGVTILVCDAARTMSVQQEMWDVVKATDKRNFVSNPARGGGLHNYGAAVDVTLVGVDGTAVDMGCAVDYFGEEARTDREPELVNAGKITPEACFNRGLLRRCMTRAGFLMLPGEWWHFNLMSRPEAIQKLSLLE